MAKTLFNLRLDDERLRWVRGYAVQRGTSASGVVVAAIDLLRGMATGGVPDVPLELPPRDSRAEPTKPEGVRASAAKKGRMPRAGGSRSSVASVAPRPAAGAVALAVEAQGPAAGLVRSPAVSAEELKRRSASVGRGIHPDVLSRQRKLNAGKYGKP